MPQLIKTIYCTHSKYKKEEWQIIKETAFSSKKLADYFEVEFRAIETEEPLERDIEPHRDCRRLLILRKRSHDEQYKEQVFT